MNDLKNTATEKAENAPSPKYMIIKERLDDIGKTQRALAAHLGIEPPTLWKTIYSTRPPQPDEISKIAQFLGWDVGSFARYVSEGGALPYLSDQQEEESVRLPYMNVEASAGKGVMVSNEYVRSFMKLSEGSLAGRLPSAKTSVIIAIKGDSMEPTLKDGDFIVVDTEQRILEDGKVFVIRAGESLFVKRLFLNPIDKTIIIKSDNPLHPDWPASESDIAICGKVVAKLFCKI